MRISWNHSASAFISVTATESREKICLEVKMASNIKFKHNDFKMERSAKMVKLDLKKYAFR